MSFLRDPVGHMRKPLHPNWPAVISIQVGAAMLSGAIVGAIEKSFWDFFLGLFIFPITSLVTGFVCSAFIYYFFSLFQNTFLDFKRLHAVVVLSMLPYFLFHAVSGYLPPIDLIGFSLAALLMIVGLVEQFSLERRLVIKLIAAIGVIFLISWSVALIRNSTEREKSISPTTQFNGVHRHQLIANTGASESALTTRRRTEVLS